MRPGKSLRVTAAYCRLVGLLFCSCLMPAIARGQFDPNAAPIRYDSSQASDRVARLMVELEQGRARLSWDEQHGWLPGLLTALEIPRSSQTLVFSKTSAQHQKIDPSHPRAIYYNDDTYIGFVRSGDFLEIAAVDSQLGAVFYKVDQQEPSSVRIERDAASCLACHDSNKTENVPGFLVRSVFPQSSGLPEFRLGTTTTDHATDFSDRFGGWYVTGRHGKMRHRGNSLLPAGSNDAGELDREAGANLSSLPPRVQAKNYLEPSSDILALMILEHQSQFHNRVARASYETRRAMQYQQEMNRLFDREPDFLSDSTQRRIQRVADRLVEYLFFCDEAALDSPIQGSPKFVEDFLGRARPDSEGRSLRDLDLQQRMMRYPCSYLVYGEAFCELPDPVRQKVKQRMDEVLCGQDSSPEFDHLRQADRTAIAEILAETHPWFMPSK